MLLCIFCWYPAAFWMVARCTSLLLPAKACRPIRASNNSCLHSTHAEQLALFPSQVLTSQPDNGKAIFRRGRAQLRMGNTDAAERDLTRAAALSPADAAIMRVRPDRGSCCCRAVTLQQFSLREHKEVRGDWCTSRNSSSTT